MDTRIYDVSMSLGELRKSGETLKKKRREPEMEECAAFVEWAQYSTIGGVKVGEHLTHVPNEAKRGWKAQGDLKKLGVQSGYPDYILDVARCGYHGLRIEAKAPKPYKSKISDSQLKWQARLTEQGYLFVFCYGVDEMRAVVTDYLTGKLSRE
ncbi:VRR-NUC domain-containing protein [Vibrio salinus]|uniref:VRR-NUC domain-containing protein n=1 Tax=Vibrio salinus TaxID=2899784 RepID=UPI001E298E80|nr:VRR-NUC domain-containing protein [Vibrio salinus]MCE0495752.1 VRR-NUC domain-containing protein [Vibrio salinus]